MDTHTAIGWVHGLIQRVNVVMAHARIRTGDVIADDRALAITIRGRILRQ